MSICGARPRLSGRPRDGPGGGELEIEPGSCQSLLVADAGKDGERVEVGAAQPMAESRCCGGGAELRLRHFALAGHPETRAGISDGAAVIAARGGDEGK